MRGQANYQTNRSRCHKQHKLQDGNPFINWMVKQVRKKCWSLDICVGYARVQKLFPKECIVCSKTLYNELWAGNLPLTPFDLPEALSRKPRKCNVRKNRRILGKSIDERPEEAMNSKLLEINAASDIELEKEFLLPYKPKLELAAIKELKVNKYGFVSIENNFYSVPDYLVGKKVTAKIYHSDIDLYANNHYFYTHKKRDGSKEISIDIRHYLTTFERKPGALRNSFALKSMVLATLLLSDIADAFLDPVSGGTSFGCRQYACLVFPLTVTV